MLPNLTESCISSLYWVGSAGPKGLQLQWVTLGHVEYLAPVKSVLIQSSREPPGILSLHQWDSNMLLEKKVKSNITQNEQRSNKHGRRDKTRSISRYGGYCQSSFSLLLITCINNRTMNNQQSTQQPTQSKLRPSNENQQGTTRHYTTRQRQTPIRRRSNERRRRLHYRLPTIPKWGGTKSS